MKRTQHIAYFKVPYKQKDNNNYRSNDNFCCGDKKSSKGDGITDNEDPELNQFYYHSDHLGSSSYITNLSGNIVQHIEYVPFGEVFLEERNNKWNTPYLFNSKELDEETGLYYYGARYYNSRNSLWLSVDPLVERTMQAYVYCSNNPIRYIDPDGQYELPASQAKKYQRLNHYLKNGIQEIANNKQIVSALKKYGEFTDKQIKEVLTYGKGPKINVTNLKGAYGEFSPGIGSDELRIDIDLVERLDKATGDEREALLFLTAVTILHETTHYGDDQDGKDIPGEEGEHFEKAAYGKVINESNAKKVITDYIKNKKTESTTERTTTTGSSLTEN